MFAYYVHHLSPSIIEFSNGMELRWYGLAYVSGFVAAYQLLCWFSRRGYFEVGEEKISDFIFAVALFGVLLGGRLGYAIFYNWQETAANPLGVFRVWEGGMASHGGILGIIAVTAWYAWRHRISWLGLGDALVVAAPIGIFFGRLANFVNGELYGRATKVPWAIQFPTEILENQPVADRAVSAVITRFDPTLIDPGAIVEVSRQSEPLREVLATVLTPRHPSQIYGALLEGLLLFIVLWIVRTRWKPYEGVTTGLFFIGYAVVRIFDEFFREPDVGISFTLGLTRGQFLSLFLILIGIAFLGLAFYRKRPSWRPKETNATGS